MDLRWDREIAVYFLFQLRFSPNVIELASEKVAELVKSFEHVNEILDGFRYKQEPILLILRHSGLARMALN